ncbi:MAG TPA: endospore germination permease, partial [Bacillota bacterium]|nr:endospore germination permease [Bacillota bacterium]
MAQNKQGLTNIQATAIVIVSMIGLAVLSIPSIVAEPAGIDGLLSVFAGGIVSLLLAGVIIVLSSRFPNHTIIEYMQIILGKTLGKLFGCIIALYTLVVAAVILRGFADAMKVLLLPKTPLEFMMIAMLVTVIYQIQGGVSTIAKISEVFILPIIGVIVVLIVFSLPKVEMFRFRAILSSGLKPIILGTTSIIYAYLGYGILAFLLPFMKDKNKLLKYGSIGVLVPTLIYTGLVFVSIGISGPKSVADLVYPTVQLARGIMANGTFIERFDIFFIIFWILAVFTSLTIYMYMN